MRLPATIALLLAGPVIGTVIGLIFGGPAGGILGALVGATASIPGAIRDHQQQQADQARITELQKQTADLQHRTDPQTIWDEKVAWESRNAKGRVWNPTRYRGQR
jgi:hypothetical protein